MDVLNIEHGFGARNGLVLTSIVRAIFYNVGVYDEVNEILYETPREFSHWEEGWGYDYEGNIDNGDQLWPRDLTMLEKSREGEYNAAMNIGVDWANDSWLFLQHFSFLNRDEITNIDGTFASDDERLNSLVNTLPAIFGLRPGSKVVNELVQSEITRSSKTFTKIGGRKNQEWGKLFEWGKGPQGAADKLANFSKSDVKRLKNAGVRLRDVKQWSSTYDGAINKGGGFNQTAIHRRDLMDAIINLW